MADGNSDTNDRARFNMLLSQEQKRQWENYADESPNVDSLSHLVRLAVQKEMGEGGTGGDGGAGEEVKEALSEMVTETRKTNNRLEALEARIGTIEQAVQHDPGIAALKNEVFAVLPSREDLENHKDPEGGPVPDWIPEEQGGPVANSGRVADIATLLDETELRVQRALDKLEVDTARLQETDGGRYFKEV